MTTDDYTQIGLATLNRFRIFPLDQQAGLGHTDVYVPEGTYPILRSFDSIFMLFSGQLTNNWRKIGDGLFILGDDSPWGPTLTFPGRVYGMEQFTEFLTEPLCNPGPDQRYTILMNPGWDQ